MRHLHIDVVVARVRGLKQNTGDPILIEVLEILEELVMAVSVQQSDIDALNAALGQVQSDLATASNTLQSELDSLEAQVAAGAPLPAGSLANAQAAAQAIDQAAQAIGALVPVTPAPAPAPAPAPPAA